MMIFFDDQTYILAAIVGGFIIGGAIWGPVGAFVGGVVGLLLGGLF